MSPEELPPFVALDFETADHGSDSACQVGLVRVEDARVVRRESRLIRPPLSRLPSEMLESPSAAVHLPDSVR